MSLRDRGQIIHKLFCEYGSLFSKLHKFFADFLYLYFIKMCIMTLSRQAGVDIHSGSSSFGKLSIFIKVTFLSFNMISIAFCFFASIIRKSPWVVIFT